MQICMAYTPPAYAQPSTQAMPSALMLSLSIYLILPLISEHCEEVTNNTNPNVRAAGKSCQGRIVSVLEGGYDVHALGGHLYHPHRDINSAMHLTQL